MRSLKGLTFTVLSLLVSHAFADPWWTGPLLAPAGHTVPAGHSNFELYNFSTTYDGLYGNHWNHIAMPNSNTYILQPLFTHGLTDYIDIQYSIPYVWNRIRGKSGRHISDIGLTLGYQALEQGKSRWKPDIRLTLQETVPSGRYQELNPAWNGADATGLGSYQTAATINLQHLFQLTETNYLRMRLSLSYVYAAKVSVVGANTYGGNYQTDGHIDPGDLTSIDLAGEFSLTQHWVAVMEAFGAHRQPIHFTGFPGLDFQGLPLNLNTNHIDSISLAPAIEYNFNANVGIIGGCWFSVAGKNSLEFESGVVALNIYW